MIGLLIGQERAAVPIESAGLSLPDLRERLHDLHQETRQLPLCVGRVLPADNVIADECEIGAHEYPRAEADANWERLVVAVAQTTGIGVARVRRAQLHEAEKPLAVM